MTNNPQWWLSPRAPTAPSLSAIGQTSLKASAYSDGDGGSPITAYEIGYGTDPDYPEEMVMGSFSRIRSWYLLNATLTGLTPGQRHYVWGRCWNMYGFSDWSDRSSATTLPGAWVDVDGVKKVAIPYVRDDGVWKVAESWTKIEGLWKAG